MYMYMCFIHLKHCRIEKEGDKKFYFLNLTASTGKPMYTHHGFIALDIPASCPYMF